jgi:hypothetical protein
MRSAVDGKRTPTSNQRPSASDPWTVSNGTYLVDGHAVDVFIDTVTAVEQSTARIRLEATGPLPPYSFAGDLVAI